MKSKDRQKLAEWLHVRHLNDQLGVVPDGALDEDGERPDFIIQQPGGRTLGIEVTEFHWDPKEKARGSEQEGIVSAACAEHRRRSGLPLMVRVYWNSFGAVRKSERNDLANALATTVIEHTPPANAGCVLDSAGDDSLVLPAHIDRLDIYRYDEDPYTDWMSVRYGTVPALTAALVDAEIQRKNALLGGFRQVDELWLLIGFGGRSISSWADLTEDASRAAYTSRFDRLFLTSYAPRLAVELRAVKSVASPI
jgi:hypothetical protein